MGSFLGKSAITLSPTHAVTHLKPTMIESNSESVRLDITNYSRNQIIRQLDKHSDKLMGHKATIVSVLNHNDFIQTMPEDHQEIHFINSRCESILQIHNGSNEPMDRVMAINVDVLEKQ